MNQFSLEQLTEGIRDRHMGQRGAKLVQKWAGTGLLRGLSGYNRENMAQLLENQAAQVLRESNALSTGAGGLTSSGQVSGFTNIAFPMVRRVFAGLIANELVSMQPMSLPSGLLFYLDYTYGTNVGGDSSLSTGALGSASATTYKSGQSIYSNPTGKGVRSGSLATGGMYDLVGASYTKVHQVTSGSDLCMLASGSWAGGATLTGGAAMFATGTDGRLVDFDPQLTTLVEDDAADGALNGTGKFQFLVFNANTLNNSFDTTAVQDFTVFTQDPTTAGLERIPASMQGGLNVLNIRRHNKLGTFSGGVFTVNPLLGINDPNAAVLTVVSGAYKPTRAGDTTTAVGLTASYAIPASLSVDTDSGSTLTIPSFESNFATSPSPIIPEIDIKVESLAVTATTRKLRARWSPELAQDLNAYHSLDAEVELTQILSEQIALEIDREILGDLLLQANGANLYWSRAPGKFVNKTTGAPVSLASSLAPGPNFTGTVREWYETFIETIIDAANTIHRKTLRGSANFIVVSPDVATILEASVAYRPNYALDGNGQVSSPLQIGCESVGTLSNRFTVYKDPYFPRNKVLVGYKGGSYLETGYVYAPYVPLIVTPTIFAPEDFTPRKGVMTRYGKKMVRSDFYGTVTVMDLNVI